MKPTGPAGPGASIASAVKAVESRRADAVVIGGVHSDYDPRTHRRADHWR